VSDAFYSALFKHFEVLEQELNQLDAATGDGDHGTTLVKALRAIAEDDSHSPAKVFRRAAGGASGSLFAQLIDAFDQALHQKQNLSQALLNAADRISQIGQAVAGDKTMLDALLPAAQADSVEAMVSAAHRGADSTIDMIAKRGRARYVEGGGAGHKDAGATSVAEMFTVFARYYTLSESE
jgi:dihydroxyacetone kinase-like protein